MPNRHPCTFTDAELDRLPVVNGLPDWTEIVFCYRAAARVWAVSRSGDLWVRTVLPEHHPLVED